MCSEDVLISMMMLNKISQVSLLLGVDESGTFFLVDKAVILYQVREKL